jgi:hypothetical protein
MLFIAAVKDNVIYGIGDTVANATRDAKRENPRVEALQYHTISLAQAKRVANGETKWPLT